MAARLLTTIGVLIFILITSFGIKNDFDAFYAAAVVVQNFGFSNLYSEVESNQLGDQFYSFAYPPITALLLSPLSLFEKNIAKVIFFLYSIFVLLISAKLYYREKRIDQISFTTLLFGPNLIALQSGQLTPLLLSIVYLSNRFTNYKGYLLGLFAIKPNFFVCFLIFQILTKEFRIARQMILVLVILYVFPLFLGGVEIYQNWFKHLLSFSKIEWDVNSARMVDLGSVISRILSLNQKFQIIISGILFFLLAVVGRKYLKLQTLLSVLLTPHVMFYDAGLILPAIDLKGDKIIRDFLFVILSLLLVALVLHFNLGFLITIAILKIVTFNIKAYDPNKKICNF